MPRTILIHLNLELPDDSPLTAENVQRTIEGVLEVGLSDVPVEYEIPTPVVALCEEI